MRLELTQKSKMEPERSIRAFFQKELVDIKDKIIQESVDKAPADTGYMRQKISGEVENNQITLKANTDYAVYVEKGTQRMVKAHGQHDWKKPVTQWEALKKRGGVGQEMPFMEPSIRNVISSWRSRR